MTVKLEGEPVSNHDELMCNFFAQADALAYGKTIAELQAEVRSVYVIFVFYVLMWFTYVYTIIHLICLCYTLVYVFDICECAYENTIAEL